MRHRRPRLLARRPAREGPAHRGPAGAGPRLRRGGRARRRGAVRRRRRPVQGAARVDDAEEGVTRGRDETNRRRVSGLVGEGSVVVDKPAGLTSHDVVARLRRLAGTRKVGHAGTLDPMATGVLVVGVGRATRLLGYLCSPTRRTTPPSGSARPRRPTTPRARWWRPARPSGVDRDASGPARCSSAPIDQVPSAVSAIKVDGRRAYERVRAGEDGRARRAPGDGHRFEVTRVDAGRRPRPGRRALLQRHLHPRDRPRPRRRARRRAGT